MNTSYCEDNLGLKTHEQICHISKHIFKNYQKMLG